MRDSNSNPRVKISVVCMPWLIGFFSAPVHAGDPVIFFSDLDSGPPQAYVTVWGNNLGAKKGTVMMTGNAGVAGNDIQSWRDTKIEFRIPKAGGDGIKIRRNDGKTSNTLPFATRSGRIFFVSKANGNNDNDGLAATPAGRRTGPWRDLSPMLSTIAPGDIVYVRTGLYDEVLGHRRKANLYIREDNSGSAGFPIALISYPAETPVIGGIGGTTAAGRTLYMGGGVHDWTIAKLRLSARSAAITFAGGNNARIRIVGNSASRIPSHYGTINLKGCTDCKILGNHVYDSGKPGNKLAHLIYYEGFGVGANVEIAWNVLHDEHGGRGIQVFGHTDRDRLSGLSIHDNIVYNCPYDGILVGSSDAAYKPWISDALVYNNVVYNSGGGIRINNRGVAAKVFHNTLHNNSFSVTLQAARSVEMSNNISSLPKRAHLALTSAESLSISHNGYYGTPAIPAQDTNPISGDPLFSDPIAMDFSLKTGSPFLNKGKPSGGHLPAGVKSADRRPDLGALPWKSEAISQ